MPDLVIAARDAPATERYGADLVCDGRTDVAVLAKALAGSFDEVALSAGRFDANAGTAPAGNRYLRSAEGVTVRGAGPGLTRLVAEREPCRVAVAAPGNTAGQTRYRARGLAMKNNRIRIVTDRPMETVEVHKSSVNTVNMAGVTVEYYPPRPAMV